MLLEQETLRQRQAKFEAELGSWQIFSPLSDLITGARKAALETQLSAIEKARAEMSAESQKIAQQRSQEQALLTRLHNEKEALEAAKVALEKEKAHEKEGKDAAVAKVAEVERLSNQIREQKERIEKERDQLVEARAAAVDSERRLLAEKQKLVRHLFSL